MKPLIAVTISAFRSDEAVIDTLRAIAARPSVDVAAVIVVDSLGSGAIQEAIAREGWDVRYENASENLGSAGNLARRLELAAEVGCDWAFCLNHDAKWDPDALEAQLELGRSRPRIGAVYPVLHHGPREKPWEDGRRTFSPFAKERLADRPQGSADNEVLWSSSNGALYATAPAHEGIRVMPELWMGYEDLAYGIALHHGGWMQLISRDAVLSEIFDYTEFEVFGVTGHRPDKPVWYPFYDLRNLLLIRRRYGGGGITYVTIVHKLIRSASRIALVEDHRLRRMIHLLHGAYHGLRGRLGKGPVP